jgi:hypothetical protein
MSHTEASKRATNQLPPGDVPIWLLDVDGVINASRPGWGNAGIKRDVWVSCRNEFIKLRFSPELVAEMVKLIRKGAVEIRWATSWCCEATRLEEVLRLPYLQRCWTDCFDSDQAALPKAVAAQDVLRQGRRLIWTDDVEVPEPDTERYARYTENGRALLIKPKSSRGLRPGHIDLIKSWIRKEENA